MRRLLATSVSVIVLLVGAQSVRAQEGEWFVGFGGGVSFSPNDEVGTLYDVYEGTDADFEDALGSYVTGVLGYRSNQQLDLQFRLSSTELGDTSSSFDYDGYGAEVDTSFNYQTLDAELGYTADLGETVDLRFAGGIRILRYADRLQVRDKIAAPDEFFEYTYDQEYIGLGPRVAVQLTARQADGPLGMTAALGASTTFGAMTTNASSGDRSFDKSVSTVEGKVMADYHLDGIGTFSIGYRAEKLFGAHEFDHDGDYDTQVDGDVLAHGPVIEFLAAF